MLVHRTQEKTGALPALSGYTNTLLSYSGYTDTLLSFPDDNQELEINRYPLVCGFDRAMVTSD